MTLADYRGARGASAGDDFHQLWALRQALGLMDPESGLVAVTVEGLIAEDEAGEPRDTWDGVDCALYYGGEQAASADRVVLAQLKYSGANPDQTWTAARLSQSTNKAQDNSVIGRLAKAFTGLMNERPDLVADRSLVPRLVSNQPVDPAVLVALEGAGELEQPSDKPEQIWEDRARLMAASGLPDEKFSAFAGAFDLSDCGHESRFALEAKVLQAISTWTETDARREVDHLMRFIRRAMLPEAKREVITRETILAQLGLSDPGALFPCPSVIDTIDQPIPRSESKALVARMLGGDMRICLHGGAGCGKTTVIQEIETLLPEGSVVIVFDCYGGGRYLDSDTYRHRPRDAFLQLSNDLARRQRTPLLVSPSPELDYPRTFKKRLAMAADVVAAKADTALLMVVVDAADNSVTAARSRSPQERSFVHDFTTLGDLPENVRLAVTVRTGRLADLSLPDSYICVEMEGFTLDETAAHVGLFWGDAPEAWIEDFQHLSNGNPRVQRYALERAGADPVQALDYLRPHGKDLEQIFQSLLEQAHRKVGQDEEIETLCAGLIALPRPIPVSNLAEVTGLNMAHVRDLCADLAPGVRLKDETIGFADEDFEEFVRAQAAAQLPQIQARIANHFLARRESDPYAATHVASALFAAGRGSEIIDLISSEPEPEAIGDPVLRREVQLGRLRMAMKVCRETGNNADAILTILIGAEALKTNLAIQSMLTENPDLAARFARDTSSRVVLRDPDEIEHHGPLLFQLMAEDARRSDGVSVREGHRQVQAWMHRRVKSYEDQRAERPQLQPRGWDISYRDIAAETEAALRIAGPRHAVESLRRWRPKSIALRVAALLAKSLITAGEATRVEGCLAEGAVRRPWDLFLLVPLALAGKEVELSRLEWDLSSLLRRGLIHVDSLRDNWNRNGGEAEYVDTILTACEVVVDRGGNYERIVPVLERIADHGVRRRDRLFTSQTELIDFTLRAHSLLERLAGRQATLETYWLDPPDPPDDSTEKDRQKLKREDAKKKKELSDFIGPLMDLYDVRAQILIGTLPEGEIAQRLRDAISRYQQDEYRAHRQPWAFQMKTRAALSITRLMSIPDLGGELVFECACELLGSRLESLGSEQVEIFGSIALDESIHEQILASVGERAEAVKGMRISAEDKVNALVEFSRLLAPISRADAESLFNDAVAVAGEVNAESVHEVALFAPLVRHAAGSMDRRNKRAVARDLAVVVGDAGVRLEGYDHFPWEEAGEALATLDLPVALAATARWEDAGVAGRHRLLPTIIETALSHREMPPAWVVALSPLLDRFGLELSSKTLDVAREQEDAELNAVAEELAKEELLRFGFGKRPLISERLVAERADGWNTVWIDRLRRATAFHQSSIEGQSLEQDPKESRPGKMERNADRPDPLADIEWKDHRYVSGEEIDHVVDHAYANARAGDTFVHAADIFESMRNSVSIGDRVHHLEALVTSSSEAPDYEVAQAIADCVEIWKETPSVRGWCENRLLQVVTDKLPAFSRWLIYGESPLPFLLKECGASPERICTALLEGMERHVDALDLKSVYAVTRLIGQYSTPQETAQVVARYADRLVQRIPAAERENWDLADIPAESADGLARFLYALMSDIDVRIRWRAAHALRRLVRLTDGDIIDRLIALYERKSEDSYRVPDGPFYWLAARLWLVIALDRIAAESPTALRHHGEWLLEVASDNTFPHVVVRMFACSAATKLEESGLLSLDSSQAEALKRTNSSQVQRKKARNRYRAGFDRYTYKEKEDRRFRFDLMDTLPYWYTSALRAFADVAPEEYLDCAERWIVNHWEVRSNPWRWDDEPRRHRFSERSLGLMHHDHGSWPTLERYSTYLEWHAMWCASGELIQTRALTRASEDDCYSFEEWLGRADLTMRPYWLADLRTKKPLEERLWAAPTGDVDEWVDAVTDTDLLNELGLIDNNEMVVVCGDHDTRSSEFMMSCRVESALVSPETAGALVRALQTVNDSHDYMLPPAGHRLEIDVPPYELRGWLSGVDESLGIDKTDPLRYGVRAVERFPSEQTVAALELEFVLDDRDVKWVRGDQKNAAMVYEAWGDVRGDESEDRFRFDDTVRSSGLRLRADRETLRTHLNRIGLDLVVEVEITRRNRGYEYWRHKEKTVEARFDRVILLRRDGAIETAEGRLGTWAPLGP